jgi:hypothetical protein
MSTLNPTLTRRSFLGGAGASVAVTVAHSTASALLPPAPLAVNALLEEDDALAGLEATLANSDLELRAIFVAAPYGVLGRGSTGEEARERLASAVHRLLIRTGSKVPVFELQPHWGSRPSFGWDLNISALLLGSFSRTSSNLGQTNKANLHPTLIRLLGVSPWIYVDDPLLASRITNLPALTAIGSRIIAGLCSPLDPAVDFALTHLRSGAIGEVTEISASLRQRDRINRLEAAAIHRRLVEASTSESLPALRLTRVASVHPAVTLYGRHGQVQIALYTAHDRHVTLPLRLERFTSIARDNHRLQNIQSQS